MLRLRKLRLWEVNERSLGHTVSMWQWLDSNKIYWTSKPALSTSGLSREVVSEPWRWEWDLGIPSTGREGMGFKGQSEDGGGTNFSEELGMSLWHLWGKGWAHWPTVAQRWVVGLDLEARNPRPWLFCDPDDDQFQLSCWSPHTAR